MHESVADAGIPSLRAKIWLGPHWYLVGSRGGNVPLTIAVVAIGIVNGVIREYEAREGSTEVLGRLKLRLKG